MALIQLSTAHRQCAREQNALDETQGMLKVTYLLYLVSSRFAPRLTLYRCRSMEMPYLRRGEIAAQY